MKSSYTEVTVKLQDIIADDLNPETIHSTVSRIKKKNTKILTPIKFVCHFTSKQILSVVGGDALSCQIVLYNLEETRVYNSNDMKIDVSMGCVKIVFLNWFVNSVLVRSNLFKLNIFILIDFLFLLSRTFWIISKRPNVPLLMLVRQLLKQRNKIW